MPPNQRKIIGPESSMPWRLFLDASSVKTEQEKRKAKFKDSNQGSNIGIYLKLGVLTHVKGSAYLEIGQTKVIAAVYPPRECSKQNKRTAIGSINCELKYDRCACANANKTAIVKNEKYYSILLKKALEPAICRNEFPNFQIDIVVHVLDDSGSVLSSAINCAGAALIHGGVPMFDIIVASTAFLQNGQIALNPPFTDIGAEQFEEDEKEENDSNIEYGTVVLAQLPTCNQICECFQKGYMSFDLLKEVHKRLNNQNQHISKVIQQVIIKNVKESLKKEKQT